MDNNFWGKKGGWKRDYRYNNQKNWIRITLDYVASDLLSQAEHGPDSQVILVSLCKVLIEKVEKSLKNQSKILDRIDFINQSISNSKLIYFENKQEASKYHQKSSIL